MNSLLIWIVSTYPETCPMIPIEWSPHMNQDVAETWYRLYQHSWYSTLLWNALDSLECITLSVMRYTRFTRACITWWLLMWGVSVRWGESMISRHARLHQQTRLTWRSLVIWAWYVSEACLRRHVCVYVHISVIWGVCFSEAYRLISPHTHMISIE